MKRHLLAGVAMGLALLLPTPAFACVPVPARTWKGSIQIAGPQTIISNTTFSNNGCKWLDPALNGFDARVFDVSSHRGLPGKVTWTTATPVKPESMFGYFRTASCGVTGTAWSQAISGKALSFSIPSNAKWLIVQSVTTAPSRDIAITITSPGRKCPTA